MFSIIRRKGWIMREPGEQDRRRLAGMFRKGVASADREQVRRAFRRAGKFLAEMERKGIPEGLSRFWTDIRDLYGMLRDALAGRYSVPFRSLAAVAVTLLYLANPFDLIPDFIPGIGYIDDVFMLSLCLKFMGADLEKYRQWRSIEGSGSS